MRSRVHCQRISVGVTDLVLVLFLCVFQSVGCCGFDSRWLWGCIMCHPWTVDVVHLVHSRFLFVFVTSRQVDVRLHHVGCIASFMS